MDKFSLIYFEPPEATFKWEMYGITRYYLDTGRIEIWIDSTRTKRQQKKTLKHELSHIALGHLSRSDGNHSRMEREARRLSRTMSHNEFKYLMSFCISVTTRGKDYKILSP